MNNKKIIALVTGGSKGVGRGIAKGLGESGATVYVTGRTENLYQTVEDVTGAGGKGIAVFCDHTNDDETRKVHELIKKEEGKLDILVNNVWGGYEQMFNKNGEHIWEFPFWRQPLEYWDLMFKAGVRVHYVNSVFAARQMTSQGNGLIVNISYWAAQKFAGNVAYGVSKAATDKLTSDIAHDLRRENIPVVSLYPGLVRTERVMQAAEYLDLSNSESPQFIGRVISGLSSDPNVTKKSGTVQIAAKLAIEYGIQDFDGKQPVPLTYEDI